MPRESETLRNFYNVNRNAVLTTSMTAIWDALNVGVAVVDASGICCYMNPIQRRIDNIQSAVGKHITSLYLPQNLTCIPTIECLQKGKPILGFTYTYKTTNNFKARSMSDFFPLFNNGIKDGVLTFTVWLDKDVMLSAAGGPDTIRKLYTFDSIIGQSEALTARIKEARIVSKTDFPIMIWGESGTGKEVFAQAIHSASSRCNSPFMPINCAAIPDHLLEGILFGSTKGTFTDAEDKPGLFEEASGGTLLLDEFNSMSINLQSKLLRVLQDRRVRRLGSSNEIPFDVRIISILNRNPFAAIKEGQLRSDIFYRLAVAVVHLPSLRERREDIPLLAEKFIGRITEGNKQIPISKEVMDMFRIYDWPGNIRELEHVLQSSLPMAESAKEVTVDCLPSHFLESFTAQVSRKSDKSENGNEIPPDGGNFLISAGQESPQEYFDYKGIRRGETVSLKECLSKYEKACIMNVLRKTGGNVAKAARMMKAKPAGFRYRIKLLGIDLEN